MERGPDMTGFHIDTSKIGKKTTGEQYIPSQRIDWSRLHQAQYGELQEHAIGIDREALQRILQAEERKLERELSRKEAVLGLGELSAKEFHRLHNSEFKPMHTETYRVPDELRGIKCRRPAHDTFALRAFINSNSPTPQPEKETMNKIYVRSSPDSQPFIMNTNVFYTQQQALVIRGSRDASRIAMPYKLAEIKGKLTMDNAALEELPVDVSKADLVPAQLWQAPVSSLQPGDVISMDLGAAFVISATTSPQHKQDIVVRYLTLDGTYRVETLAAETIVHVSIAFNRTLVGPVAFKKSVFDDYLVPLSIITNGNENQFLGAYRILQYVEKLGQDKVIELLNAKLVQATYNNYA
jgi:uncharacterized membrane protein YciS (DUF1049 family)